jgi:hypothetical protein
MPTHNFQKAALAALVTLISYILVSEELLKSGAETDHAELVQAQGSSSPTQQLPVILLIGIVGLTRSIVEVIMICRRRFITQQRHQLMTTVRHGQFLQHTLRQFTSQ